MTTYYNYEESPLWEPTNLLEDYATDYSIFSLQYAHYINREQLWKKFIRTNDEEEA